jgi:hypothetical protein
MKSGFLILGLLFASPIFAQDVLGTAVINGRSIEIMDDGTWAYAAPGAAADPSLADCFTVSQAYAFCGKTAGWFVAQKLSPAAAASFQRDDRNYGMVISESIGIDDGISLDFMERALVANAAIAAGLTEADITMFSKTPVTVFEQDGLQMVYGLRVQGLNVVYANTVFLRAKETTQFLTYTIAAEPDAAFLAGHTEYVSLMRERTQ